MGHIRIGRLPKSRQWSEIVDLIGNEQAEVSDVARAVVQLLVAPTSRPEPTPGSSRAFGSWPNSRWRRAARTSRTVFGITAVESRSKQMPLASLPGAH